MSRRVLIVVMSMAASVGCGGGGGGGDGDGTIQVTFSPASINAYVVTGSSASVELNATVSPEPTASAYPVLVEDASIIRPGPVVVSRVSPGVYQTTLSTRSTLAVGAHQGTLRLRICKDSQCASEYTLAGATIPIEVTVQPHVQATVTVGSTTTTVGSYQYGNLGVQQGQTVTVVTNIPATFTQGSSMGGAHIVPSAVTDKTWTGTLSGTTGEWVGIAIGSKQVPATNAMQVLFSIQ